MKRLFCGTLLAIFLGVSAQCTHAETIDLGYYNGHRYFYDTGSYLSFDEAQQAAQSVQNRDLVSISSEGENSFISNAIISAQAHTTFLRAAWIGLYRSTTNDPWVWVSGESASYFNWRPGNVKYWWAEPTGETFAHMYINDDPIPVGYWADTFFSSSEPFNAIYETTPVSTVDGLVAYYPFDGNANDASANQNHGVEYGNGIRYVQGKIGQAVELDGASYIKAHSDPLPTSTRTISLWFRAYAIDNHPLLLAYGGRTCGESFIMMLNHGFYPGTYHSQGHCLCNLINYEYPSPPIDGWYHWAITLDRTRSPSMKMYVNGVCVAESDNFGSDTYVVERDLAIGVGVDNNGLAPWWDDSHAGRFMGCIDDVRIYNRALSDEEIQILAGTGSVQAVPATSPLAIGFLMIILIGVVRYKRRFSLL